ncbi:hypothetical protein [Pseudosulfitobacter pseudonitzschiae]|uniref:hypothetical protein n=1 Tax=Pseudosulfitobacter pseudonitzschiae TaxID=1402135 RepID=UPI003B7F87E8
MNFYLVSADGDDYPDEPLMAETVQEAADLYVQAVLDGKAGISVSELKRGVCIFVDQFVAPDAGSGLMKDTVSTTVPMRTIPSWTAYLEKMAPPAPAGP